MTIPFWMTKINWAYQDGRMWRSFKDWAAFKAAWLVPPRVAYWCFFRVMGVTGGPPDFNAAHAEWMRRYPE